jgi:hypothetical protein
MEHLEQDLRRLRAGHDDPGPRRAEVNRDALGCPTERKPRLRRAGLLGRDGALTSTTISKSQERSHGVPGSNSSFAT